jgi:spermidine synthase
MARRSKRSVAGSDRLSPSGTTSAPASMPREPGSIYLGAAAFLAGLSVMIIELAASRVLAPSFGNTLYTWTALIGVVLLALSGGYFAGGALVDRFPRPAILLHLLSAAAIFVLLIPLLAQRVTATLAPEGQPVDLLWTPLIAASLLFAMPSGLLGTATPIAVKLLSLRTNNERVGTSAGSVAMLSTVGSVLGTFGAGFFLIPALGIVAIFSFLGLTLAATSALGFFLARRPLPAVAVVLLAAALATAASRPQEADGNIVFQTDTFYHRISILRMESPDGRGVTFLLADGAPQGAQADSGQRLVYAYNRCIRLQQLFCTEIQQAAFLGGGAYSMPQALSDEYPAARIDVVEIDPELETLARRWFRLNDYQGRLQPVNDDARRFLAATNHQYDLIFGDVFRGRQTVPPHLATREFFQLVKRRLSERGVYMMNVVGAMEGPRNQLLSAVAVTLQQVFGELYVFAANPNIPRDELQNWIFVAPKLPRHWTKHDLMSRARGDTFLSLLTANLTDSREMTFSNATVLTDDYSPIEYLAAQQIRD